MTDAPIDVEATEEPGTELEVVGPAPATLFHTDDPGEVIVRATAVANALSEVLRTQKDSQGKLKLISTISGREHVRVEGWTLCGTLLGVFPVCVWSRKITGEGPNAEGWEARVEARTLSGAVIGAAEAQCMRTENQWSWHPTGRDGKKLQARDDYALRSMAQTRATSKALRQPLGFIVQMAGFETTPAEEMPVTDQPRPEHRQNATAVPTPTSWPKVKDAMRACDNPDEAEALYEAFLRAATYHLYGKTSLKEITAEQRKVMLQKAAGAAVWLAEHEDETQDGPFSFYLEPTMRQAWAAMLDGTMLEIPDYEPPEPEASAEAEAASYDEEAARLAAEAFADPT